MVNINLLPWRKYRDTYQIKILKQVSYASIILVVLSIMPVHVVLNQYVDSVAQRIDSLKMLVSELESQQAPVSEGNEKSVSPSSISIRQLSSLFSSFGGNNTQVCFLSISRRKQAFIFTGNASSVKDLSLFIKAWRATSYFSQIQIEQLQQKDEHLVKFRLRAMK